MMFPGVIEQILTNPVDGLDNYQEMMRLLGRREVGAQGVCERRRGIARPTIVRWSKTSPAYPARRRSGPHGGFVPSAVRASIGSRDCRTAGPVADPRRVRSRPSDGRRLPVRMRSATSSARRPSRPLTLDCRDSPRIAATNSRCSSSNGVRLDDRQIGQRQIVGEQIGLELRPLRRRERS